MSAGDAAARGSASAPGGPGPGVPQWLSSALGRSLLRTMLLIRAFEEAALEQYKEGNVPGALHVSIGQEACSTGACAALADGDLVIGTHRSHGDVIARGGDPKRMMAELFGRSTGYCRGKGGSMHILDAGRGVLGANGIVAAGLPIAVGASLRAGLQDPPAVVLAFFGDGAVAKGNFHEALTLAAMWRTPTIFFCQNNSYAVSMSIDDVYSRTSIRELAAAHGMPAERIDGNDVLTVLSATRAACDRARQGGGPSVVVADTYRWMGHNVSDAGLYRRPEELEEWRRRDPVAHLSTALLDAGLASADDIRDIHGDVTSEIAAALAFARESPEPPAAMAYDDVYSDRYRVLERTGAVLAGHEERAARGRDGEAR